MSQNQKSIGLLIETLQKELSIDSLYAREQNSLLLLGAYRNQTFFIDQKFNGCEQL